MQIGGIRRSAYGSIANSEYKRGSQCSLKLFGRYRLLSTPYSRLFLLFMPRCGHSGQLASLRNLPRSFNITCKPITVLHSDVGSAVEGFDIPSWEGPQSPLRNPRGVGQKQILSFRRSESVRRVLSLFGDRRISIIRHCVPDMRTRLSNNRICRTTRSLNFGKRGLSLWVQATGHSISSCNSYLLLYTVRVSLTRRDAPLVQRVL